MIFLCLLLSFFLRRHVRLGTEGLDLGDHMRPTPFFIDFVKRARPHSVSGPALPASFWFALGYGLDVQPIFNQEQRENESLTWVSSPVMHMSQENDVVHIHVTPLPIDELKFTVPTWCVFPQADVQLVGTRPGASRRSTNLLAKYSKTVFSLDGGVSAQFAFEIGRWMQGRPFGLVVDHELCLFGGLADSAWPESERGDYFRCLTLPEPCYTRLTRGYT